MNGKTALDIAVNQENNEEIIDYLLANGAKDDTIEPLGIVNPEE
ncbi:ankyrin repeat domain-containing protein [Rickettsia felis]